MAEEKEREYVAPWEDPRVHSDNCILDKECWFWLQGGDPECDRIKCNKRAIVRLCD